MSNVHQSGTAMHMSAIGQEKRFVSPAGQLSGEASHVHQSIVPQMTNNQVATSAVHSNGQLQATTGSFVDNTRSADTQLVNGTLDNAASGSAIVLPIFVPALELHMKPVNTLAHHFQTKPGSDQSKSCNMNPKATHEMRTKMYSNSQGFGTKTIMVECKGNIERMKAAALAAASSNY